MQQDRYGWWVAEAGVGREPRPALTAEIDADVVVLGGGYTGMWAAWWIRELEPDARVVVLEADRCGLGPSGRNGGFVNSMWFSLPALRERFGERRALQVCLAAADSVREVGAWCERNGVDAWYRRAGYMQVSAAPAQDGAWAAVEEACSAAGVPDAIEILDAEAARARCDSPRFRAAALYPDAATVHPGRLAAGLRDRLLDAGVAIHERTPARVGAGRPGELVARTSSGAVRAPRVVLATGPALAGLDGLRRALTVTSSHIVVTEPVPDLLDELGWTGGECITDSRAMINYFRTTRDGRIAFGWGGGRIVRGARTGGRAELDPAILAEVEAHLRWFFPQLESHSVTHGWGGPIDVSPTHLPIVRSLSERIFAAFGYTGNGVGPAQLIGRTLASLALDRRDDPSRLAFVDPPSTTVPPEPVRWLGGTLIRRAILRKEQLEERGRLPGRLTRTVASIPERIGIHVGR